MPTTSAAVRPAALVTRAALALALACLVVVVVKDGAAENVARAVLVAAAVVAAASGVVLSRAAHRTAPLVAAVSALGLAGSVLYLHSLADEPAAIPLAGAGVLFLSVLGILVTVFLLPTSVRPARSVAGAAR